MLRQTSGTVSFNGFCWCFDEGTFVAARVWVVFLLTLAPTRLRDRRAGEGSLRSVVRHWLPAVGALKMTRALGAGVTRTLGLDAHG
jgi:hypothetical protein